MKKNKAEKILIAFLPIATIVILILSISIYRSNLNLTASRLILLSATYHDLQCDIARAEQDDFRNWSADTDATGRIYLDSRIYSSKEDDQRLIALTIDYAYSASKMNQERKIFLSKLQKADVAVQWENKWYGNISRIVFFNESDRRMVEQFLTKQNLLKY